MLTQLVIKNFTIVDQLEIDIPTGMTAITGETGAGKSIMLDALSLALGERADSTVVRNGAAKAEILATFELSNCVEAQTWLKTKQLESEYENECILRRVISREGRSRSYINGSPSPLQDLRELGSLLLEIHGQHAHHSLLKKDCHRQLLDEYGQLTHLYQQLVTTYKKWQRKTQQLEIITRQSEEQQAKQQLLDYQLSELTSLELHEGEVGALEKEQKLLSNIDALQQNCQQVIDICSESESTNLLQLLNHSLQVLSSLNTDNPQLLEAQQLLINAQIQVEEAESSLQQAIHQSQADPQHLQEIEHRLSCIYDIARKHRTHPTELVALQQQLENELNHLAASDELIAELETTTKQLADEYFQLAVKLSKKRQLAANKLSKAVTSEINRLGMPQGQFEVKIDAISSAKPLPSGLDSIEFLVTANPGQSLRPIQKVASGGELSRISLAIQVVTAQTSTTPTLIFDEVDVGISGGTAEVVGSLLRQIGNQGQVLCVTHLPQVASQGHHHFNVKKAIKNNTTFTQIEALTPTGKVSEIARLLGGVKLTDQTLAYAEEMLLNAQTS
ncbi:DNA repair protein RecN [Endozoicomonas sp. SM1973]|uniref:DNA repair protein RecN n=1 Tax=Spartinivicinus marinus TaxID=2994442 RepID=A0A853I4F0_9GAMM|nr:DNA repair protein RecN [Spartinivicinus marinus]MCX4027967.1 DNA repair protein RecN [Spartinivicinus marinus]NYZ68243.1 DNA repair protein RecN [Spartinivicinus marinus]